MFEVKEFFFKYQEVCSELTVRYNDGDLFAELNENTQFVIFTRAQLMEMFQNINLFGDLLETLCVG